MTDIVERLREMARKAQIIEEHGTLSLAADEIEGLRGAALPSRDALDAARRILDSVAEMKGKKLAVAFRDEQTANHVSFIIENAAKVSRALLQADK